MATRPDETSLDILLDEFGSNKKYKEKLMKEVTTTICAMLNSNDGKIKLHIVADNNQIPVESLPETRLLIRIFEQAISNIGVCQSGGKIRVQENEDKGSIEILVYKADCLVTKNYNLYLPSESQVLKVLPKETFKEVVHSIIDRKINTTERVTCNSHCKVFKKGTSCGMNESRTQQFKCLKATQYKNTTLADRMMSEGNKFRRYVSAFGNENGGHVYYGIRDDGVVEGELVQCEEKRKITKRVASTISKMFCPKRTGPPKRGEDWEIFFEQVADKNSHPVTSTFVIVIYIAPCLGGVFIDKPECYEMVNGKAQKMSFKEWIYHGKRTSNELVVQQISRIQWSSCEIKLKCTKVNDSLMMSINEGDWFDFEQKTEAILREETATEVRLIVLSKKVIANSRRSLFEPAKTEFKHFCELSSNVGDSLIFETLKLYLRLILKRNIKDFRGIEEFVAGVLANADMIKSGFLTVPIDLLVATVISFHNEKSIPTKEILCRRAIWKLRRLEHPNFVTSDLEQKAYLNLVFCKLKCVLSKDLIIAEPCSEADIKEAQAFFKKFNEIAVSKPVSRFREIQGRLARSILYYRKAEVLGSSTPASEEESTWFLKCALNLAKESKELAMKLAFNEMVRWSDEIIKACSFA